MNALILGKRRQGKSTLSLMLSLHHSQTVIIFDPNCQFLNYPAMTIEDIERSLFFIAELPPEQLKERGPTILVFRPTSEQELQFEKLCDMLWVWEDYALIIDECSILQSPHYINAKLERLMRQAPASVHIIQSTHREQDTNGLVRMIITDAFFFATRQRKDLAKLGENYDDRLPAIVKRLPIYHVCHWWPEKGGEEAICVWTDPTAWHLDIGRRDGKEHSPDDSPELQPALLADIPGTVPPERDPKYPKGGLDDAAGTN